MARRKQITEIEQIEQQKWYQELKNEFSYLLDNFDKYTEIKRLDMQLGGALTSVELHFEDPLEEMTL